MPVVHQTTIPITSKGEVEYLMRDSLPSQLYNNQSTYVHAGASVGIAYASLHAGPAVQNLKPHADALSHYTSVSIMVRSSNKLSCSSYSFTIKGIGRVN